MYVFHEILPEDSVVPSTQTLKLMQKAVLEGYD